jgi:ElaB/YqjD/DUF883 family membrane-anchored ribosome-binding protein
MASGTSHRTTAGAETEPSALFTQVLGQLGDNDIEAMAFVVLMEAAKSAQEDLKQIMAEVKAINAAKQRLRDLIARVNRDVVASTIACHEGKKLEYASNGLGGASAYHRVPIPVADVESRDGVQTATVNYVEGRTATHDDLQAVLDDLKNRLDSMTEMSEMTSLRLQMAMDRRAKFITTLSNLMKKISDTQDSVIQNLK